MNDQTAQDLRVLSPEFSTGNFFLEEGWTYRPYGYPFELLKDECLVDVHDSKQPSLLQGGKTSWTSFPTNSIARKYFLNRKYNRNILRQRIRWINLLLFWVPRHFQNTPEDPVQKLNRRFSVHHIRRDGEHLSHPSNPTHHAKFGPIG